MPVESLKDRASIVVEEYLQTIYSLLADGQSIKAIALVNWIGSSPSTVHATLTRLKRDKLVKINAKKEITLTPAGQKIAEQLMRRHRLVEWFLCNKLGIAWHEVHKHAHVMEHALTALVEEKLSEYLDYPTVCPHGTPLSSDLGKIPEQTQALDKFQAGDTIEIVIINEILEESVELMKFLEEKRIVPGQRHSVVEKIEITKTIVLQSVESEGSTATLTYDIAGRIGAVKAD